MEEIQEALAKEEAYKINEELHCLKSFHAIALSENNYAVMGKLNQEIEAIMPQVIELWTKYYRSKIESAKAQKRDFLVREGHKHSKFELEKVFLPDYDKEILRAEKELNTHLRTRVANTALSHSYNPC